MQKLSIITVNFNNDLGLKKTIQSVLGQTYPNIEYIVIDGGSMDGSKDIIQTYENKLAFSISEPDGGIYYGMNKGILHATGDYILFLNSGDYLDSNTSVSKIMKNSSNEDLIVYRQKFIDASTHHISLSPRLHENEVNVEFFLTSVFPHQATLIKRTLFDKVGLYRTDLRIVSDWAFWTDAVVRHHASFVMYNYSFSIMEKGGTSSDIEKCQKEMMIVANELLKDNFLSWTNIFHVASLGRRYQYTQRNLISRILEKIAVYIGKNK